MHEGQTQATNNGNVPRGSTTLSGAPNWLAAESVSAGNCLPPRYKMRMHAQCQCRTTIRTTNEAVPACVRAYVDVTTIALHSAWMPGCGRNLSVERRTPEKDALQRHVNPIRGDSS
jgi:hypothetical protein